jgi:hypothetical protein
VLFAKQKSRPLVGVGSYLLAAVLGYYVSPLLALTLFVWMIAYHAITSEGLHANRLAQARSFHAAGSISSADSLSNAAVRLLIGFACRAERRRSSNQATPTPSAGTRGGGRDR